MALQNTRIQVAAVVLAMILSFAYLGNQQNMRHNPERVGSRAPASIQAVTMASTDPEQLIREINLAESLAHPSASRSLASVGQPVTDLDALKLGTLEGKYNFKLDGGHIVEISFIENSIDKPTIITNRANFLGKYAEQFGAASKPERLSAVLKGDHLIETYRVKATNGPDRLIQVTLGEQNTFLALETKEAPTLQLF